MRIAVEGCCHGELDKIYDTVTELENQRGFKIDLLLICGDFQAVRNFDDLQAMAVPQKFQKLNTFYKYYSGEKKAPVLTVFIGGNHEASNFMQELPYGGWVAPNIYYMGYASIIQVGGVRIGGISGIYKGHDFNKGHFEYPPYERDTVRSVYHVRNLEVFRLKQLSQHTDIFLSHDWPRGIYHSGNVDALLRKKPFFKQEIEENRLGAQPLSDLLKHLQPTYWFAAHLHVKFAAHVHHTPDKSTRFLSLDKCLPRRHFLQVLEIPHKPSEGLKIKLDPEWLTILRTTNHLLKLTPGTVYMPGPGGNERHNFSPTEEELQETVETFGGDMTLPENFVCTSPPIIGQPNMRCAKRALTVQVNPQTTLLCTMLDITDPNARFLGKTSQQILDESAVGSPAVCGSGASDGSDSNESGREMPSMIDSSMDASFTSSSLSTSLHDQSGWESFHTAHESVNDSRLVASTPLKSGKGGNDKQLTPLVLPPPCKQSLSVEDDDEEFLSILSAQKRKSITSNLPSSSGDGNKVVSEELNCSPSAISNNGSQPLQCNAVDNSHQSLSPVSSPTQTPSMKHSQTLPSPRTVDTDSVCDSICSSNDSKPALKAERSSLGLSGLHLSSEISSPPAKQLSDSSPGVKRPSPSTTTRDGNGDEAINCVELTETVSSSSEQSPSVKRLKRRNVSVYSETSE